MSLRSFILDNFWLKTLSLILACGIWFSISDYKLFGPRFSMQDIRCSVAILSTPAGRSALTVEPSAVTVKVQAEGAALKKLGPDSLAAYIKLADASNPKGLYRVEVIAPRDVTVKEIVPELVSVLSAN